VSDDQFNFPLVDGCREREVHWCNTKPAVEVFTHRFCPGDLIVVDHWLLQLERVIEPLSLIHAAPTSGVLVGLQRPLDMAAVIRSKDAGINRLTFDILFTSGENYEAALRSNVFDRESIAKLLDMPVEHVVGTFFVDTCNAIKISIDRPNISASMDERDVFGAQQQAAIEALTIPIYAEALARASAF
jgi:hypothetical protein